MKNLTYTTLLLAFLLVKTLQNGVADRMDEPMPVVRIFYDFLIKWWNANSDIFSRKLVSINVKYISVI